jgi:hypothetical protein
MCCFWESLIQPAFSRQWSQGREIKRCNNIHFSDLPESSEQINVEQRRGILVGTPSEYCLHNQH